MRFKGSRRLHSFLGPSKAVVICKHGAIPEDPQKLHAILIERIQFAMEFERYEFAQQSNHLLFDICKDLIHIN